MKRSLFILSSLALGSLQSAEVSASATPPAVDGGDIANYENAVTADKWWPENNEAAGSAKGQTFTTGNLKVLLKSVTYQITPSQKAEPTKTYKIRVGSVFGNIFTEIHSETATQTFTWNGGEYMTWTLDTPVLLDANSTYGIDVGITSSTSGWQSGIPYITVTGNSYAGGWRYSSGRNGLGSPQMNLDTNRDRVFHLDLEFPPQGFQFVVE